MIPIMYVPMIICSFICCCCRRHLPQLILRGDQVVMVFKKPLHY